MFEHFKLKTKKGFEITGLLMCVTGAVVWFFASYFIFIKVLHDSVKLVQRLF
jgi:hypothetical protein